ncbi:MAG: ABC transporter substrate-binding protein [Actinomycetota bacterium]
MRSRLFALFLAVLVFSFAACTPMDEPTCRGQAVRLIRPDVLTVGTDFAFPPFAFDHPETGEPAGFDVELADAIADQLGLKVLLVNRTSGALIPGLLAERHDLAASALIDRPRLRSEVCLSEPYLPAHLGLLTKAVDQPPVADSGDLAGRAIGVVRGSRGEAWLRQHLEAGTRIVRLEASDDLAPAVREGAIDAAIDDLPAVEHAVAGVNDLAVTDTIETPDRYVLAAAPNNHGLITLVNEALEKLKANGKLRALQRRWFGR